MKRQVLLLAMLGTAYALAFGPAMLCYSEYSARDPHGAWLYAYRPFTLLFLPHVALTRVSFAYYRYASWWWAQGPWQTYDVDRNSWESYKSRPLF